MPFEPASTRVVHNPKSGSPASRARARSVAVALEERGFELRATTGAGHACELARDWARAGGTGLLVLGGDGTLFEAVRDLAPGFALGQLPVGTINLMAAALRVPGEEAPFLELVRARTTRALRLGRANERRFVSVGSVGLDAEAVRCVGKALKRRSSRLSYVEATLRRWPGYRARHLRAWLDGRELDGGLCGVLFGRQPFFAQTRRPGFPGADPADERLHVVLLLGTGKLHTLVQVARVGAGAWSRPGWFERAAVRHLRVESDPPAPVELDGDFFGWTPLEVVVEDEPTPFLAP